MVDKPETKSLIGRMWEWAETASLITHMAQGLGLKIPTFDVDKANKKIDIGGKSKEGGTTTLADERYYQQLIDAIDSKLAQFLVGWSVYEFPLYSSDWVIRRKAHASMQEFRMMVCGMDREPKLTGETVTTETITVGNKETINRTTTPKYDRPRSKAKPFLEKLASRIKSAYEAEVAKLGHVPSPDEKQTCLIEAFRLTSVENVGRGMPHYPTTGEKHWTDITRAIATYAQPKAAQVADWSTTNLTQAARAARANAYLSERKARAKAKHNQKTRLGRLFERWIQSM